MQSEPVASSPSDSTDSLRALGDGFLADFQGRLERFAGELQREERRLIQLFAWISATIFTALLAVAFAGMAVVFLLWERARLVALSGLALLYTILFCGLVVGFRRFLARQLPPFAATIAELKKDRASLGRQE